MAGLVSESEIRRAAARLEGIALRTPLVAVESAATERFLVKAESLQPTGAFKLRGAYNALSALPPARRRRGVIAHSSGNHAHAVAYAASLLGGPATVVVPVNAPDRKVAAAQALGARIVRCEPGLAARQQMTGALAARYGYTEIPPFDHRDVIAGQGTIGLEIAADCPDADLALCPVGGGGLISGVAAALAAAAPWVKVIGVEPELAADARDSLRQRQRVRWPAASTQRTIADALRAEQVGELPIRHLVSQVHDIVTVSDDEIRAAMRVLATDARLVSEPAGAVATAACLFRAAELPAARLRVVVLSGGNVDQELFAAVLADGGRTAGLPAQPPAAPAPPGSS